MSDEGCSHRIHTRVRSRVIRLWQASPNTGVNTLTSDELAEVLKGAQVIIDVSTSPANNLSFLFTNSRAEREPQQIRFVLSRVVKHLFESETDADLQSNFGVGHSRVFP